MKTKFWGIFIGIIFAIALIIALFFTTMNIVVYGNMPDSFVSECEKYEVLDIVGISREDLTEVSEEMFEYLRGNRDTLADITATIHGEPDTPFFNEKECLHMADCQGLFLAGFDLLRISSIVAAALFIALIIIFRKNIAAAVHSMAVGILAGTGIVTAAAGILAVLVSQNFYKYFTLFHEIFFDNDLWILDESTDRLLMIMPTGYFMDCVKQIGLIFGCMMILLLAASIVYLVLEKRKHNETGYPYSC